MALIKCPECGKEISDKVKACPHCGYPLEDNQQDITIIQAHELQSIDIIKPRKKIGKKILIPVVFVFIVIVAAFTANYVLNVIPANKYSEAINLLQSGKYDQGKVLLDELDKYKDVTTIQEQIKFESIAYNCVGQLKQYLKNPDTFVPYEIKFYSDSDANKPVCIMHYGAQNGFGGNTTGYAIFEYYNNDNIYQLYGTCDSLDDVEPNPLAYNLEDEIWKSVAAQEIVKCQKGSEVGSLDMQRVKTILKNDAYEDIKIIE